MDEKVAIIDLGSNSIRMIIMKIAGDGSYKMIDQAKKMVRLSEGMSEANCLVEPAIGRALETLTLFRRLIESHKVERIVAVATAAVRNAENGNEFKEKVKRETGFDFSVVSGEEEAYFDYLGVVNTIDLQDFAIVDTGGGSTEIVLVEDRNFKKAISIPYGAVVLTEKFLIGKDGSGKELKELEDFIKEKLEEIPWLKKIDGLPVIGLGGTIRNLAKIHKTMNGGFVDGLHNYTVDSASVKSIYENITEAKPSERKKIPGMGKDRSDIIVGGLVPLRMIMDYINSDRLISSGNGLREGVFFKNFYKECGLRTQVVEGVVAHSVNNILKKYDANIAHGYQVSKLALQMFDQLDDLHGLDKGYRKLLEISAILHDIGLYVDYYDHHSHGFYLVMNSGVNGLNHKQLVMCSFIVALHRNEDFKRDWKEFELYIDESDFEAVRKLGMFVRVAEGLDRNEYGYIERIECSVTEDSVKMKLDAGRGVELEIAAAKLSGKAFKKLFGKSLRVE